MNVQRIRARLKDGFRPFGIITPSGNKYPLPHPEFIMLTLSLWLLPISAAMRSCSIRFISWGWKTFTPEMTDAANEPGANRHQTCPCSQSDSKPAVTMVSPEPWCPLPIPYSAPVPS